VRHDLATAWSEGVETEGLHRSMTRRWAIIHGLLIGGLAYGLLRTAAEVPGFDAFAYWSVRLDDIYRGSVGDHGFFPYSPAAAVAAAGFQALPWPFFLVAWWLLLLGVLRWLTGSWRWFAYALMVPPVLMEIATGNIHLLLAAAVALGFRYPAAWSFVLLTKVTPAVGLVWFLARREWRSLAMASGATAALAGASFLVLPGAWLEWFDMLSGASRRPQVFPLLDRVVAAGLLIFWGARTNRRWTVAVGATIALPVLWGSATALLAALASAELRSAQPTPHSSAHGAKEAFGQVPAGAARVPAQPG
jgi:hypothetical protein